MHLMGVLSVTTLVRLDVDEVAVVEAVDRDPGPVDPLAYIHVNDG
jgi:hypothetical protein